MQLASVLKSGVAVCAIGSFLQISYAEEKWLFPNGKLSHRLPAQEEKLFHWIDTDFSNICIGVREDSVRGLFANTSMPKGCLIFQVPEKFIISRNNYNGCPWISNCLLDGEMFHIDFPLEWFHQCGNLGLVLLLIYYKRQGEASFWFPFISTLPSTPPMKMTDNVFVFSKSEVHYKFDYLQAHVPDLTFEEFFWAYSVCYTRLFDDIPWWHRFLRFGSRGAGPFLTHSKAYCTSVLFPVGDLCNFSDQPSAFAKKEKGRWCFYALRGLKEGDEITFDYVPGAHPSEVPILFGFSEMESLNS